MGGLLLSRQQIIIRNIEMAFRCENIELDLGDSQFDSDLVECWELMLGELESGELQLPIMSGNAHRISW